MAEDQKTSETDENRAPTQNGVSFPPPNGPQMTQGFQTIQLGTMIQGITQPMPPLKHLTVHRRFGLSHILFGLVLFGIELAGLIIGPLSLQFGNGIYGGVSLIVTGILLRKASVNNNRGCLIAGLVLEIISVAGLTIAIGIASEEVDFRKFCDKYGHCWFYDLESYQHNFQMTKVILVIVLSIVAWILAVVHSGFSCHDLCLCCRNKMMPPVIFNNQGSVMMAANQNSQFSTVGGVILSQGGLASIPGASQMVMAPPTYNPQDYLPRDQDLEYEKEIPPSYDSIEEKR